MPTRPWRSGGDPTSLKARGNGNIPQFTELEDISKWVIGDTSSNPANKLKWIKIKDIDRTLLICDRVILNNISWDELNNARYVFGKEIVIDEVKYKCRLLTGGNDFRDETDAYSGGKLPNEWDKYIENLDNISGLPIPTYEDLDKSITYSELDGSHNKLWNWWGNYSWCQDIYNRDNAYYIRRGYGSVRFFNYTTPSGSVAVGWRPVLEILESKKYLIKQNSDYYYINHNYIKIDQSNSNNQLTNLLDEYGYEDISILTKVLNYKRVPVDLEDNNINVSWEIDSNDVIDSISLIEEEDKKYIQYNCNKYKIIDKIKKNNDGKFNVVMKETI